MSMAEKARRTLINAFFGGTDITEDLQKYLLSISYTDNEENEADDLQFRLQDRDGVWLTKWLNTVLNTAAEHSYDKPTEKSSTAPIKYMVTAKGGLAARDRPDDKYTKYGTLPYGTVITVASITAGWANFIYSGKNAYCNASYLQAIYDDGASVTDSGSWHIGDEVTVTGRPQYSSYGKGTPGAYVTDYTASITHLNLRDGIPYPICVGYLGWFSEDQIKRKSSSVNVNSTGTAERGLRVQATIVQQNRNSDGVCDILECGQFELDSVSASGPPGTVTIKCTSLPYGSTIRQTVKSKSWENYTLSGIGNEIASQNGMTCMFLSDENPEYERVEQYKTSDIAFLQKLCSDAGCSLKVSNNILVIFDQAAYEKLPAILTICPGSGYTKYSLSTGSNDTYTSCRVCYTSPDGNTISAVTYAEGCNEAGKDTQRLNIYQKVSDVAEAKRLSEKLLRLHNKYELQASFSFPGDTNLIAGCTVILSGWGAWDGKYIIKQAQHKIDSSGYTTQINLRRTLAANASVIT